KSKTAALSLQVRPGAHKPAFLIGEMRELHLQAALAGMRPLPEDFQNQPGAVDDLRVPCLFQIALLHRRERGVDEHESGVMRTHDAGEFFHLALAEISRRTNGRKRNDACVCDLEIDRAREADR